MTKYNCEQCGASFSKLSDLMKHRRLLGHKDTFVCHVCHKSFGRQANLNCHLLRHADTNQHNCEECGKVFNRPDSLQRHKQTQHSQTGGKRSADGEGPSPKRMKDDPRSHYELSKIKETYMRKFNTNGTIYKASFQDIEVNEIKEILKALKKIFNALIDDVPKFADDQDLIRLSFQTPELDYPIELPFRKKIHLSADIFLSEIERVLQSYEQFTLDSGLEIDVIHVRMPIGSGRKKTDYINLEKYLKEKRCIIQINSKDDLCCARAIVTAIARIEKHEKWGYVRQNREPQGELARQLHARAGVPLRTCTIEDIKQFQSVLPDYQINVWSGKDIIYTGQDTEKKIFLYHHNEHYDVITKMPAFLCKNYYCELCKKGYDHKERHKCNNPCYCCKSIHADEGEWVICNDCNRYFKGDICYDLHKKTTPNGNSTCKQYYRCTCGQQVNKAMHKKKNSHRCDNIYCKTCKDFYMPGHQCYMKSERDDVPQSEDLEEELCNDTTVEDDEVLKYIFFDFETTQEDLVQCEKGYLPDEKKTCKNCKKKRCGSFEHRPNLCVAHRVCLACIHQPLNKHTGCDICGKHEHVFSGRSARNDFCKWLFSEGNNNSFVIAHNFRAFDSWFVLSYLHENNVRPKIIPNGAKNMCIHVDECNIKMIDSLNFLPVSLAKLPKMFGLHELCKGYFPHLFNKVENKHVWLQGLPDAKYYNPDTMKSEERKQFF